MQWRHSHLWLAGQVPGLGFATALNQEFDHLPKFYPCYFLSPPTKSLRGPWPTYSPEVSDSNSIQPHDANGQEVDNAMDRKWTQYTHGN